MYLSALLSACQIQKTVLNDFEIIGISAASQDIRPGYIFAAIKGLHQDGADFISEAIQNGARVILADRPLNASVPVIIVDDIRRVLAVMSTLIYPSGSLKKIAVTGTNGKTSTVFFVEQLLNRLSMTAASMGTIGINSPVYKCSGSMTTPDSAVLNKSLMALEEKGVKVVAMEASSHGLDQKRLDGLNFVVSGFTNLTRDHLDYHKTMEAYLKAKMRLFLERTDKNGLVVLNADIPEFVDMEKACREKGLCVYSYGINGKELKLISQKPTEQGQEITFEVFQKQYTVVLHIYGDFQVMNVLCALGLCLGVGVKADDLVTALSDLEAPAGRMELVGSIKGAQIFIDYAHTPDALERVLNSLRPHTKRRLVCLFGCGGNRDTGKRAQMGEIAEKLADVVYITDDNPRFENPKIIRHAIKETCPKGIEVDGRETALYDAIHMLETGDILVVCGKGHETGQTINGVTTIFNDKTQSRVILATLTKEIIWKSHELELALNTTVNSYVSACGVSIDTRTLQTGDLFIALKGDHADGHDFVRTAVENGAAACLVDHLIDGVPISKQIVVSDTQKGLEALARFSRMRSKAVFIGVTGSSGKTTSKEMLKTCLIPQGAVFATQGNFNNQIGVPLMLAKLPPSTEYAIIEMGMNHTGEMEALSDLVRPNITLITMIGSAHREFFKDEIDIAAAKAEIYTYQDKNGISVLNMESPFFNFLAEQVWQNKIHRIISFGQKKEADFQLVDFQTNRDKTRVKISWHGSVYTYELGFIGRHFVLDSLGVLAVVDAVGASVEQAMLTLINAKPASGRGSIQRITFNDNRNVTLIDDTYNANPSSMRASIQTLGLHNEGRRVAVLGDMLELGEESSSMHRALVSVLIENQIDKVYTVGPLMSSLFDVLPAALRGAKTSNSIEMSAILLAQLQPEDVVLIKGSNGMKLSKIISAFKGEMK